MATPGEAADSAAIPGRGSFRIVKAIVCSPAAIDQARLLPVEWPSRQVGARCDWVTLTLAVGGCCADAGDLPLATSMASTATLSLFIRPASQVIEVYLLVAAQGH